MDANPSALGIAHFLSSTDSVGKLVLMALLLLSLASWYLIVTRAIANTLAQRRADLFLAGFWNAPSLGEVRNVLAARPVDNAFAELALAALKAAADSEAHHPQRLAAAGDSASSLPVCFGTALTLKRHVVSTGLPCWPPLDRQRPTSVFLARSGAFTMRWCRSVSPAKAPWTRSPGRSGRHSS